MSYTFIATEKESTPSQQIQNGSHTARLIHIIDLGTQANTFDPSKPATRQFRFSFETPTKKAVFGKDKGEQPFLLSKTIGVTISKEETPADKVSTLTKIMKAIKGNTEDKNIFNLLGGLISVQTEINSKGYAQIIGFAPISSDIDQESPKFAQISPSVIFYLEDFSHSIFEGLPKFIQETIQKSPEYQNLKNPQPEITGKYNEPPEIEDVDFEAIANGIPF